MNIIAHRGLWKEKAEQNTIEAFKRAFDNGFGVELDVRDNLGRLVISHDPIVGSQSFGVEEFIDLFNKYDTPLAINIKSDGLIPMIKLSLENVDKERYFIFDMSLPESMGYIKSGLRTYMRLSEYENPSELHGMSSGIWLDAFHDEWWISNNQAFKSNKPICVVSPELHGRGIEKGWTYLKNVLDECDLSICTDFPQAARDFFK